MKIGPILFSTSNVQAILENRKGMTRLVMIPQSPEGASYIDLCDTMAITAIDRRGNEYAKDVDGLYATFTYDGLPEFPVFKSRYQPGDILWVRETWTAMRDIETGHVDYFFAATKLDHDTVSTTYLCDDDGFDTGRPFPWKPSIFMPKKICRLFLRVTDVRVERVQEISHQDALAEGIPECEGHTEQEDCDCIIVRYGELWDKLNAKRGHGWDTNPWVWVYTFERAEKPEGWEGM